MLGVSYLSLVVGLSDIPGALQNCKRVCTAKGKLIGTTPDVAPTCMAVECSLYTLVRYALLGCSHLYFGLTKDYDTTWWQTLIQLEVPPDCAEVS